MNTWIFFWGVIILFSTISFSYMSGKILYKAIAELKEMFKMLNDRNQSTRVDN